MTRGLVIGKFYPPHKGHKYLIDTARAGVDELTVIVCGKQGQTISPELRAQWLRNIHPDVTIKIIESSDDTLPEDDSQAWAEATVGWLGYAPDVVYTSEDYGDAYAAFMGSKHISVDQPRATFPISGTKVRQSPLSHLDYLEPVVRAHFVKRVCILGAESSGTTTMAKALADHYKTEWVAEYGRTYTEAKYGNAKNIHWDSDEFVHIASMQNKLEDELAPQANKVLICDTNSDVTNVWHEYFMGKRSPEVQRLSGDRKYDLYFITDIDFAFVQDGFREDDKTRRWMHQRFTELLTSQNQPFTVLSGGHEQRLVQAIKSIDRLLR